MVSFSLIFFCILKPCVFFMEESLTSSGRYWQAVAKKHFQQSTTLGILRFSQTFSFLWTCPFHISCFLLCVCVIPRVPSNAQDHVFSQSCRFKSIVCVCAYKLFSDVIPCAVACARSQPRKERVCGTQNIRGTCEIFGTSGLKWLMGK